MEFIPVYEAEADKYNHIYIGYCEDNLTPPHFHNSMEIVFVCKGPFHVLISGESATLNSGEIAVSDSYDIHSYIENDNTAIYIVVISQQYLDDYHKLHNKTLPKFLPVSDGTKEIFEFIKCAYEGGVRRNKMLSQGCVTYLMGLLTQYYSCTRNRCLNSNIGVQILTYIDEHYAEDLNLKVLAEKFHYNESYFSTIFKKYTSMGLRDYINMLRISKARQLNDGTHKVLDIALRCGFDSLNTYYRALKKYGCITNSGLNNEK